jgi:hypothetical protein
MSKRSRRPPIINNPIQDLINSYAEFGVELSYDPPVVEFAATATRAIFHVLADDPLLKNFILQDEELSLKHRSVEYPILISSENIGIPHPVRFHHEST